MSTSATALSCAFPLHRHAKDAVREHYLSGIVEGRTIGAIGVTEPNVGSGIASMRTRIRRDGDEWVAA